MVDSSQESASSENTQSAIPLELPPQSASSFMNKELQKTSQSTFRIEKVLKRQGDKSLVIWMGYLKSFNYWIDTKAILKLTTEKSLQNC